MPRVDDGSDILLPSKQQKANFSPFVDFLQKNIKNKKYIKNNMLKI